MSLGSGLRQLPGHPAAFAGRGARRQLGELLEDWDSRRVLIVRGATSYDRCGIGPAVATATRNREVSFIQAAPWQVTLAALSSALDHYADFRPDTVLAVGGGSALDLAKAMTNLAPDAPASLAHAVANGQVVSRESRLLLMPTTAGSGSELTRFATLWDGPDKLSLDAPGLQADVALIDPDLVASAPVPVLVSAAADALCQAVESSWARAATDASRVWADQAYRTLLPALSEGITRQSLQNPDLHEPLMVGAALAGAAINISRTTAAHALSYPLTGRLGLPHGAAVAVFLPWLLHHNAAVTDVEALQAIAREQTGQTLTPLIPRLLALADFPQHPGQLQLDQGTRQELIEMTESVRMQNNPRPVTRDQLLDLIDNPRAVHRPGAEENA